jgi:hypothetical protein
MVTILSIIITVIDFTLPGYAWILITGIAKRLTILGRLAFSFLLSLCLLSLLTAGLSALTTSYLLYAALVPLVSLVVIALLISKSSFRSVKVEFDQVLPITVILTAYFFIVLLSFWSAPFYPNTVTADPANHAQFVTGILEGKGRDILLRSGYTTGLHFAAALFASLTSLSALQALRVILSVVVLAVFVLVYESAYVMFGGKRAAAFVALVAAFAIPIDPSLLISLGLYANALADAIIIILLWLFFSYVAQPSRRLGVTLAIVALAGLFAHTSVLVFLGAIWALTPFVYLLFRPKFLAYLRAASYAISLLALLAVTLSPIYGGILAHVQGYSKLARPLTLRVFSIVYISLWYDFYVYAGSVAMCAIGASIILFSIRYRGHLGQLLMIVWTALLIVGAFFTSEAWRFAFFALVPGYLLVGSLVSSSSRLAGLAKIQTEQVSRLIPVAILLFLAVSGTFPNLVARSYDPAARERQISVVDSMQWLSQNRCTDGVLSIGLGADYAYLSILTGLRYVGDFEEPAGEALNQSARLGFHCVAVAAQDHFLPTYTSTAEFELKYRNNVVVVFLVNGRCC